MSGYTWYLAPTEAQPHGISRRPRPNDLGHAGHRWDWRVGPGLGEGWRAASLTHARQLRQTRNAIAKASPA